MSWRLTSFVALALLSAAVLAPAAPPPVAVERLPERWILAFEQSYGLDGLYVVAPVGAQPTPEETCRANLLDLTVAARGCDAGGKEVPSPACVVARCRAIRTSREHPGVAAPAAHPLSEREVDAYMPRCPGRGTYAYDEPHRRYACSLEGSHDLGAAAREQLQLEPLARSRLLRPATAIRGRWKALASQADCPEAIRREIELREYLLQPIKAPDAEAAATCQRQLGQLADALELYAASHGLKRGDPVTILQVAGDGLLGTLERCPRDGDYAVAKVGEPPTCSRGAAHQWNRPDLVRAEFRPAVASMTAGKDAYPPAMVLRARYEEPAAGAKLVDEAIRTWPDVPGLRIERLGYAALRGDFKAMTPDLDYLLGRFPSAPVLMGIEVATRRGPPATDPAMRAELATLLARVRPELLFPQVLALDGARDAGAPTDMKETYDRLVETQPGYEGLVPAPADLRR